MFPGLHSTFAGQLAQQCPGTMVTARVKLDMIALEFTGEAIDDNGTAHQGQPFAANPVLVEALREGQRQTFGEIEAVFFEYDHAKRVATTIVTGKNYEGETISVQTRETY